jgi:hypothetical protein
MRQLSGCWRCFYVCRAIAERPAISRKFLWKRVKRHFLEPVTRFRENFCDLFGKQNFA